MSDGRCGEVMSVEEQANMLRRLTRVVANVAPTEPLTHRLCLAMAEISGLEGGSMSIGYSAPTRTTLCSTDAIAENIEELQDLSREGPGLDAHRLHRVIDARAEEIPRRWPMLAQSFTAGSRPAHLLAAPMRPDTEVLGVMTLYGLKNAAIMVDIDQVQFLANAIGVAVLGGFERSDGTDELWTTRDLVNQATGMIVAQLRIRPVDAAAVLRAHAFAHDKSVGSIAADVVDRSLSFKGGPETGPTTADDSDDQ